MANPKIKVLYGQSQSKSQSDEEQTLIMFNAAMADRSERTEYVRDLDDHPDMDSIKLDV